MRFRITHLLVVTAIVALIFTYPKRMRWSLIVCGIYLCVEVVDTLRKYYRAGE